MRINIRAPQLAKFRRRFSEAPAIVQDEMRRGLQSSVKVVEKHVQDGAPQSFRPLIKGEVRGNVVNTMRGEIAMDISTKPHAIYVETGTATRRQPQPRSPYNIYPKYASVLSWVSNGVRRFAKYILNHPGVPGRHMFRDGFKNSLPTVRRILAGHLGNITRRLKSNG